MNTGGVIYATCNIYKVITRHLNVECFDSMVPALFLSYAPTFFHRKLFISLIHSTLQYKFKFEDGAKLNISRGKFHI